MHTEELEKQIDFLMTLALQKCGDIQEAEELTQETLLAALTHLSQGNTIDNLQGWLAVVLNRRFYDRLRKKYRQPSVSSIGVDFDLPMEDDLLEKISATEEAESVRKEVAYLAKIYREVIVRHYMDGESIAAISSALNIPEGTIKRRLNTGRSQIRKGLKDMEKYSRPSYQPVTLRVGVSGHYGLNGEPTSLVQDDLVAQNLLWLAYEKPLTMDELSRAIGIPMAYVEPIMKKLVSGELMKCIGNKYYADFIITTVEEQERHIPAQKRFVQKKFPLIWKNIGEGINRIRESDFYRCCTFDQQNSLEMYFTVKCLEEGYYGTFNQLYKAEQVFPDRPHGGAWFAIGRVYFSDYDPNQHKELTSCMITGERHVAFDNYGAAKQIALHVYGLEGFPAPTYNAYYKDMPLLSHAEGTDATILKLLYLLHSGMNPNQVGFNAEALKVIPWLTKCRILKPKDNRTAVNIPVMHLDEYQWLQNLCQNTALSMSQNIKEHLAAFCKGKRQVLPPHLDSVPLQKQYLWPMYGLPIMTIREAIRQGKLYDGDYDNESGENPPPCPMIMTIQE